MTDEQIKELLTTNGDLLLTSVLVGIPPADLSELIQQSELLRAAIATSDSPSLDTEVLEIMNSTAPKESRNFVGVSDEDIAEALIEADGSVPVAAELVGLTPEAFSQRLRHSEAIQGAQAEVGARGLIFDSRELVPAIDNCEPWAIMYWLDTFATDRGSLAENLPTDGQI